MQPASFSGTLSLEKVDPLRSEKHEPSTRKTPLDTRRRYEVELEDREGEFDPRCGDPLDPEDELWRSCGASLQ